MAHLASPHTWPKADARGGHPADEGSQNAYRSLHPWPRAHCKFQRRRLATSALSRNQQPLCCTPTWLHAARCTKTPRREGSQPTGSTASASEQDGTRFQHLASMLACTCTTCPFGNQHIGLCTLASYRRKARICNTAERRDQSTLQSDHHSDPTANATAITTRDHTRNAKAATHAATYENYKCEYHVPRKFPPP